MNPKRKLLAGCALVLAAPALAIGCGGGDEEDPAELLRTALSKDVSYDSGVINIGIDGSLEGEQSGSVQADISGPFSGGEGESPNLQLDAQANVSAEGVEQLPGGSVSMDFSGGVALVDESLFVTYQDTDYAASDELNSQLQPLLDAVESAESEETETESENSADSLVDSLSNLENEGTEEVEGTETQHVSGDLDFQKLIEESGEEVPFDSSQLEGLNAAFDFYVAEEDDTLRRMEFTLSADDVPALQSSGLQGGELTFSFGIADVGEEQTIAAPSDTEPLDDLLQQFGTSESEIAASFQQGLQAGLAGGGLGLGAGSGAGGTGAGGGSASGGASGGAGGNADLQELEDLGQCLEDAGDDQAAVEACLTQ